ncbi:MAG: hypothetical protein EB156_05360 [Euryarchaeota archaeon]|nr:hypothetical protein [Euryarchaeota archaeon]NDF37198.1 hypothetical protein [Euryarchaeota archaeon]NDG22043.1 hypothetical protein [Euryarchaeota archaeon]
MRNRPFKNYIRCVFQKPVAIHPAHVHGIIIFSLFTGLKIRSGSKRFRLSSNRLLVLIILLRNISFLWIFFVVGDVFWRF